MVECARRRTLGDAEKMLGAYIHHRDMTLKDFCDRHWPCEYVNLGTQGRCVNVKAGHTKGHQLSNGRVLSVGDYQSAFVFETYQQIFHSFLLRILRKLVQSLSDATIGSPQLELEKAHEIHRTRILTPFFKHLHTSQSFISHTACYACLMAPPEHPLPCGHVLCTPCIKGYGSQRGLTLWEIQQCPQHYDDQDGMFSTIWPIYIKPPGAGVRIMSLDGGGVRGIIELCYLQAIERSIGSLPIQLFVDLIVGTSTGGIIALGLGAHGWTVSKCMNTFERLCRDAFTRRRGIGIPGIEHFVTIANDSRYETTPLERALKEAFGTDHNLFAGTRDDVQDQVMLQRVTKVAVVATTLAGTPTVLTNYNRIDEPDGNNYQYHRSDKPANGLRTWEAARATAAAPLFFKPFVHESSGQTYQDGCLYFNNPVRIAMREQKLIWGDRADTCPDIILSVGIGVNETLERRPTPKRSRIAIVRSIQNLASMATDHIQSSLNSEQTWRDFMIDNGPLHTLRGRFQRLNLPVDIAPPKMDEVHQLVNLKNMCQSHCRKEALRIKQIADRLIATSFYFALIPEDSATVDGKTCVYGTIQCRLPFGPQTRALGDILESRAQTAYNETRHDHRPCFVVQERRREKEAVQLVLQHEVTNKMRHEGIFSMSKIEIVVSDTNAETEISFCFGDHDRTQTAAYFPISGFPRCFSLEVDRILQPKFVQADMTFVKVDWATLSAARPDWVADAEDFFSSEDPLGIFVSTEYRNPGNIGDVHVRNLSERYSDYTEVPKADRQRSAVETDSYSPPRTDLNLPYSDNDLFSEVETPSVTEEEAWRRRWMSLLMSPNSSKPTTFGHHMYRNKPAFYPPKALATWQRKNFASDAEQDSSRQRSAYRSSMLGETQGGPVELLADYPQKWRSDG